MKSNFNQFDNGKTLEILQISCHKITAQLQKNKFANGNKGRCINHDNQWLTPNDFEKLCGRSNWKDWKGSILFCNKPLRHLIREGVLKAHSPSCLCSICSEGLLNSNIIFSKRYNRNRVAKNSKKLNLLANATLKNAKIHLDKLQPYNRIDSISEQLLEQSNNTNIQRMSSSSNNKELDILKNIVDNIIEQGKCLKYAIEELQHNERRKQEEILRDIEKQKIEEINAIRVEAQLHIYKMLLEQRHEKEIAVQEAIADVRAEFTRKKIN